jgi:quercetin dioxygenase-like cupin family protein
MQRTLLAALVSGGVCLAWAAGADKHADSKDGHVVVTPDKLQWKANPALPPGAQATIVSGDPSKPGSLYTIRLKVPDGFKVPPHWHPGDENVTVLQGTLMMGVGDKFDPAKLEPVPTGAFARMPKQTRHFAMAKGETIVQVHGVGPFEIHYVNPADDPRKK